jgi:predicted nucleotidyltransferase
MNVTAYAEVNGMLDELLAGMQAALGANLRGLYLYGSLVTGDFDPERSDIDLLAAVETDIEAAALARLDQMHASFAAAHPSWDGRIEVAYFSLAALQACKTDTNSIAVISPGEPLHIKEAGPDWLVNWYVVQEKGIALYGPAPAEIIPPITRGEFVDVIRGHLRWWGERLNEWPLHHGAQAYAVFTVCRALYTLRYGEQVSKRQAALWAMKAYPQWAGLIEKAFGWWENDQGTPIDATDAAQVAGMVRFTAGQLNPEH